jgi:hypothetical protein
MESFHSQSRNAQASLASLMIREPPRQMGRGFNVKPLCAGALEDV